MAYKDKETRIAKSREYYLKNKARINAKNREYYKRNAEKLREYSRNYRATHPEEVAAAKVKYDREYREKFREKNRLRHARQWLNIRAKTFEALGGAVCVKCGFTDTRALQIDHINGGGMKHSRSFSSNKAYHHFVRENLNMFQVLCANCNFIKRSENNELHTGKRK